MFKRFRDTLDSPDAFVSLVLGLAVVFVIGMMIFRYVKSKYPQTAQKPGQIQTQETPALDNTTNPPTNTPPGGAYTVKVGDTLWDIAGRQYNNSYKWVEIARANALVNPDLILVGQKLTLPKLEKGETSSTSTDGRPKQSRYTVVQGDTLWDISHRMYGDAYKWPQVARANMLANPDLIYPGNVLTLP